MLIVPDNRFAQVFLPLLAPVLYWRSWLIESYIFYLRQYFRSLKSPAPELFFIGFGDSSLDFELGVWTEEMTANPLRFRSELYFAMEKKLRENGIEVPFPQWDVNLKTGNIVVAPTPAPPEQVS